MKRLISLIIAFFALMPLFSIANAKIDIDVESNGLIHVSNSIVLDEGQGSDTFRWAIPTKYMDDLEEWDTWDVSISDISSSYEYEITSEKDEIVLFFPSVTPGVPIEFRYDINPGAARFEYDDLYVVLVGPQESLIDSVEYTVHLFAPAGRGNVLVTKTSGEMGVKNLDFSMDDEGINIEGSAENIFFGGKLSLRIAMPSGWYSYREREKDYTVLAASISIGLAFILIVLGFIYRYFGDREEAPVDTNGALPKASPFDSLLLNSKNADNESIFLSYLFYWAYRGNIEIEKDEERIFIEFRERPNWSSDFEKRIFDILFSGNVRIGGKSLVSKPQGLEIKKSIDFYREDYSRNRKLFDRKSEILKNAILISGFAIALVGGLFSTGFNFGTLTIISAVSIVALYLISSFCGKLWINSRDKAKGIVKIRLGIFPVISYLFLGGVFIYSCGVFLPRFWATIYSILIILMIFLVTFVFRSNERLKDVYRESKEAFSKFEEMIKSADLVEYEMRLEVNHDFFYEGLPYAIILSLDREWVGKFSSMKFYPYEFIKVKASEYSSIEALFQRLRFMVRDAEIIGGR